MVSGTRDTPISGVPVAPRTTISPAARTGTSIDLVLAGQDGAMYSVRWDAGIADGAWRG